GYLGFVDYGDGIISHGRGTIVFDGQPQLNEFFGRISIFIATYGDVQRLYIFYKNQSLAEWLPHRIEQGKLCYSCWKAFFRQVHEDGLITERRLCRITQDTVGLRNK